MLLLAPCRRMYADLKHCAFVCCIFLVISKPIYSQPLNDLCKDAIDLTAATWDPNFTCIEGHFEGANPDLLPNEGCELSVFRTVWYKFNLSTEQMINLHVRSDLLETPIIRLFHSFSGGCASLESIILEEDHLPGNYCIVGVDGRAEVIAKTLYPGVYFVAISTLDSGPGPFTLCLNGLIGITPCITVSPIVITGRSFGGPFSGPFFQGEMLSMHVEVWNQAGLIQSCDFFQGLVPILGKSWAAQLGHPDTSPFDARINNRAFDVPLNGLYGGTWSWYPDDVNYHIPNENIKLDFFTDALTQPALKHALYEPDIKPSGPGLDLACCDPCWNWGGSILPPGWFCEKSPYRCNLQGRVRYTFGDGASCITAGPWSFTFSLPVSEQIPSCNTDGDLELYISLFSFTDGVIGSWLPDYKCVDDPYAFKRLPVVCNGVNSEPIPIEFVNRIACPGDSIILALDSLIPLEAGVAFWSYEFNTPNFQLPSSGFQLPDYTFVFTENPGGGPGQSISVWLQAYRSARELLGRYKIDIRFLIPPKASFTWQVIGNKVKFTGPIGDQINYHWDFGDGDTSTVRSPEHSYVNEGKYLVQLIVSNACGSDTIQQEINFIYLAPDARFMIMDSVICQFDSIVFMHSFGGIIDSLTWHFQGGNPATSHASIVTVTYPDPGLFDVDLTIYNALGFDTQAKGQGVEVQDEVDLTYTIWLLDSLIYLIYLGDDADEVQWNIGDHFSWSGDTAQYLFQMPGTYPVILWAENACGRDSLKFDFHIFETATNQIPEGEDFLIYPNPSRESIYIYFHQDLRATRIWLHDMNGDEQYVKDVLEGEALPLCIEMKSLNLPAGMYTLTLANQKQFVRKKVIYHP